MGKARPRFAGSRSPRQVCRSDPHTLASVMCTTAAPGPGSGTGYSRISHGWPQPRKIAARPVVVTPVQGSAKYPGGTAMQADHLVTGELGVEALDHTAIAVHDIQGA